MPLWKFTILYEGRFTRPVGQIYDCFDYERDTCEDFTIPAEWNIYPGADFGEVNAAGILIAEEPVTGELFAIHEYHSGQKRHTSEHVKGIKEGQDHASGRKISFGLSVGAGGARTEEGLRELAAIYGLWLDEPPNNDVETQIQCVYNQLSRHRLKFFRKACPRTIESLGLYSREIDEDGNVTDKIADKAKWHLMDALRYVITKIRPPENEVSTIATYIPNVKREQSDDLPLLNVFKTAPRRNDWDLTGRAGRY